MCYNFDKKKKEYLMHASSILEVCFGSILPVYLVSVTVIVSQNLCFIRLHLIDI